MASGLIQPRQTSSGAWRNWIKQGLELVSRKWPAWITVMTACCLASGYANVAEPIAEYLTLAVGFNLAVTVDHEADWTGMASRFASLLRDAVIFAVQVGIFVFLVTIPLNMAITNSKAALGAAENNRTFTAELAKAQSQSSVSNPLARVYEKSGNHLIEWAMVLPVGLGFLYPLRSLGAGFIRALVYGQHGAALNRNSLLVIAGFSFASVSAAMALDLYPLIPLIQGFWMAVNYVMFRDIFLGISENRRVQARTAARFTRIGMISVK
ncbi:hypothetical protein [Methylocaldum szegediense]|uniref:Transmembrane protein n=1 Tax=Methylocaldum szegediense TaxID=73780 RepID=A0ABN8X5K8_9GAMM|nr:hypothetical protein [Methylocaldum szegediense]CAI8890181.1 conserved membrane protein of unknown function [Methylocaldum szegediense]